jgi:hypothetical protein
VALLTRLNQQQHQHQQNASAVAAAAAAAEAAAAAGAAVAGVRLPSAGSKRARLCSATGSQAGDAIKHAASGGSSSSHQQLSADEELDEDLDNAGDDYAEATAGSYGKRSRSPYSAERLAQSPADAEAAAAAAAEHMDGDEDDEKSQDDLDAAQCLQQLAMSAGAGEAQGANHTSVPALFESVSDRFAAGPNRGAGSNLVRWPSTNATMPGAAAGAAAGYAGSSSSNGNATLHGGGNGGNGSPFDSMMQAQLLAYLGALNNPEGFAGFHNPRAQQRGAQPVQQKRVSLPFGSAPQPQAAQQQQPQHHFGGVTAPLQRSGSLGASWGPATKSPAPAAASGSMSGVARARKQSWVSCAGRPMCLPCKAAVTCVVCTQSATAQQPSCLVAAVFGWTPACKLLFHPHSPVTCPCCPPSAAQFQTEISEKIPVSVQQACISDWQTQKSMQVVCADLSGTFYVNSAGEYLIKLAHSGEVVTPNKFEEMAGKKTARNWQQSIRLVGEYWSRCCACACACSVGCWMWCAVAGCCICSGLAGRLKLSTC